MNLSQLGMGESGFDIINLNHKASSNNVSESSCHIELFSYYFLLRWAAVWITKRNTCQFTFIYICECGFAFRINLFGAGRWQASRLTYNNPSSSSCSVQGQSTGTHKPEASLHVHHEKTGIWADLNIPITLIWPWKCCLDNAYDYQICCNALALST